jgi:hypothetical protein
MMTGGLYTWYNNQECPILEKLDRILVSNKEWEDIFPYAIVKRLPRERYLTINLSYNFCWTC